MNALVPVFPDVAREAPDQFVVSHGKAGALGVFTSAEPMALRRGQHVIVETPRGVEMGAVLRPATHRQAMLLGATSAGALVRRMTAQDEFRRAELAGIAQSVFEAARARAEGDGLALEILDVDLLFDGVVAIVQFVGKEEDTEILAQALERQFGLTIRLENLAMPAPPKENEHGCDKPDCGRTAGGGCTTCSTGGGCSTCGSSKVDLREYFGHLRTKMEEKQRIPLP